MTTSAQLGGDGLGYHWMDSQRFALICSTLWVRREIRVAGSFHSRHVAHVRARGQDWNDPGACFAHSIAFTFRNRASACISPSGTALRTWLTARCATLAVATLQRLSVPRDAARPGYRRAVRPLVALPTLHTRLWRRLDIFRLNCIFFRMVCLKRVGIRIVNLSIFARRLLLRREMARAEAS